MKLIRINLLPYREQRRQAQQQALRQWCAAALLIGLAVSAAAFAALEYAAERQNRRNAVLQAALQRLDGKWQEAAALKQEKADFLQRRRHIERLQAQRYQATQLLDTLNRLTPSETVLTALQPDEGHGYLLSGLTADEEQAAALLRALNGDALFTAAELVSLQYSASDQAQQFTFRLHPFSDGQAQEPTP